MDLPLLKALTSLVIKSSLSVSLSIGASVAMAGSIPYLSGIGTSGGATSHGDTLSSDTTFRRGPQSSKKFPQLKPLAAACPNIMMLSDGKVMATCVDFISRQPKIFLFNKNGRTLASLDLSSATLLGGVYAYANEDDNVLFVNADNDLITIEATEGRWGSWSLSIKDKVSIDAALTEYCATGTQCDGVVAINPGSDDGDVWFATQNATVGVINLNTQALMYKQLAQDEAVANSFSTALDNVASVVTDEALYLLVKDESGINIKWRRSYDKGIGRKPGQLSWGTGATPSFFGPNSSDEYITILDNASPLSNLLVYRAGLDSNSGDLVCKLPILAENNSGSEDSAIAYNNSVVVNSTYGYPYPQYPRNAGVSVPESANFVGGLTRIDVNESGTGCTVKWVADTRSAALPKLSIRDNLIYTVERTGPFASTSALDSYKFISIDFDTGITQFSTFFGYGLLSDPLQTAGNINVDGSYWQGIMNGIVRIKP